MKKRNKKKVHILLDKMRNIRIKVASENMANLKK